MNPNSTYAFYGSLRRGMCNHELYQHALEFQSREIIAGFQLYAMKDYPYAIRTCQPGDLLTVEVYKITDPLAERDIHDLELEVGYHYDEVDINGNQVGIYLYKKPGHERLVKGGDWVQFFGSR